MGTLHRTIEPVFEPVTLQQARNQVATASEDDNFRLEAHITTARISAETFTRRTFIDTTYEYLLDRFPAGDIPLDRPPLQAVNQITYYDPDGVLQTLDTAVYEVDTKEDPGYVRLAPGQSWPSIQSERRNGITVTFRAGYGPNPADVPQSLRDAILLWVDWRYGEGEDAGKFDAYEMMLQPFKYFIL